MVGEDSSGEVEFFILALADGLWIGLGSDHTDRKVEAYNVTVSKQACAKPIAQNLWFYDDVIEHWDQLVLRSFAHESGGRTLYQEGPVTTMLPPEELIGRYLPKTGDLEANTLMFCGTLAVQGGVRPMAGFEIELEDPTLGRKISHRYAIRNPPKRGVGGGPGMGDQLKFGALNNVFGFHLRQAYTPFGQAYREAAANSS